MAEQSEQSEQHLNTKGEHLTFAEAGERLNISADAVRMRVRRGRLASVQLNDRTFVVWPQPEEPEHLNEQRTEHVRSDVQEDSRLVAALEAHIASLEHQLAERSEEIRRRDHIIAGFLERLPEVRELAPGHILDAEEQPATPPKTPYASQDAQDAPGRVDPPEMTVDTLQGSRELPIGNSEGLWQRLWRAITGG